MLHLLLFVLYLALFTVLLFAVQYFLGLFSDKRSEYKREELLDYKRIYQNQWSQLIGENHQNSYMALGIGILFGFLFVSAGGLKSYITHSAIFPVLLFFALPALRGSFPRDEENKEQFFIHLIHDDLPLFYAFSLAVMAEIFVANSIGQVDRLWALVNAVIVFVLILIKTGNHQTAKQTTDAEDDEESPQAYSFADEENSEEEDQSNSEEKAD